MRNAFGPIFYNSSYNGSYNGSYTVPTRSLQFLQKSHARAQPCKDLPPVLSFLLCPCDAQRRCGGDLLTTSLQSGDKTMPPEHMQNSLGYLCLRVQSGIPSRPERKKTSPLYPPKPPPGCGQPAPPLQRWRLRNTVLKQEGNDFFAPRNLSPTRLRWQPTLHRLGVRGCGTASMDGEVFFARDGLGCDGVALLSSCVCCVEHGCWQELPMGATHSI